MGGEGESLGAVPPPSVSWAQRSAQVFLIFNVECEKPQVEITPRAVEFRSACGPSGEMRAVRIPLYAAVVPDNSTTENKGRYVEVVLAKERGDEPWWPTLTSDNVKHHWLKVDFERWRDEEESEDDMFNDTPDMFSDLGGADPAADDESSSSEEEDLPDLE